METKFTPAPWHIDNPKFEGKWSSLQFQGKCRGIYATNDDLEMIAFVPKDRILQFKDQDYEANANLISAAPDLFEALKYIYSYATVFGVDSEIHVKIVSALNKAVGSNLF